VRWLDDLIRIPGTNIHIGLDPILGFVFPGLGDVLTGTGSIAVLYAALKAGVPTAVLARMLWNIAVDALLGSVPVLGDAFDVYFRANRRNLDLVERHARGERTPATALDYLILAVAFLFVLLSIGIPLAIGFGLGRLFVS
jgi:hypothetical protein